MSDRADKARQEGLRLAVDLYSGRRWDEDFSGESVIHAAREFAWVLYGRADQITLNDPVITEAASPGRPVPIQRTGATMAVTITDTQVATYSVNETDSKGFPVSDPIVWSEDSAGAVVTSDGAGGFTAVAPGTANITATDGSLSASDAVTVDNSAPTSLVLGTPVVTEQAPVAGA